MGHGLANSGPRKRSAPCGVAIVRRARGRRTRSGPRQDPPPSGAAANCRAQRREWAAERVARVLRRRSCGSARKPKGVPPEPTRPTRVGEPAVRIDEGGMLRTGRRREHRSRPNSNLASSPGPTIASASRRPLLVVALAATPAERTPGGDARGRSIAWAGVPLEQEAAIVSADRAGDRAGRAQPKASSGHGEGPQRMPRDPPSRAGSPVPSPTPDPLGEILHREMRRFLARDPDAVNTRAARTRSTLEGWHSSLAI